MAERTIWRVRLELTERQQLQLPPGSRILSVQRREGTNDQLDLWVEVNAGDSRRMFYNVRLVGTGHRAPDRDGALRYVSTVQVAGGAYVFHVYATAFQPGEVRVP